MTHTTPDEQYIYILLTHFTDRASKTVKGLTNGTYTHASIGIDNQCIEFYSIVTKGFRIEQPRRFSERTKSKTPCCLYKIKVNKEDYELIKEELEYHLSKASTYKYTKFGVFLCFLHISHKIKNHYFCSQFVAEILHKGNVLKNGKSASLYLPDDFTKIKELDLCYQGNLQGLFRTA